MKRTNLFKPIQKSVEWYKRDEYTDILFLFDRAINGMQILKKSYGKFETIQHTIDYYISILDGTISSNHFVNNQFELMKIDSLNTEISSNDESSSNNSNNNTKNYNNYKNTVEETIVENVIIIIIVIIIVILIMILIVILIIK